MNHEAGYERPEGNLNKIDTRYQPIAKKCRGRLKYRWINTALVLISVGLMGAMTIWMASMWRRFAQDEVPHFWQATAMMATFFFAQGAIFMLMTLFTLWHVIYRQDKVILELLDKGE